VSARAGTVPRRGIRLDSRLRATAHGEWIKFRSVRSGPFDLVVTALIVVVGAWLLGDANRGSYLVASPAGKAAFDPVFTVLQGIELAQLFIGALGVITLTGEYTSGLIRGTFVATPQRAQVLAMKALVFTGVVWACCTAMSFAAFFLGQSVLSPAKHVGIGDPGVLTAVFGGGLYGVLAGTRCPRRLRRGGRARRVRTHPQEGRVMSRALTASDAGASPIPPASPTAYRRAGAVLATEWIKLRSLRSMLVTPLVGAVASVGLADSAVYHNATGWAHLDAVHKARFDPLAINFNFVIIGILLFGVLGALVATNEYGSGLIRATLAATPQRGLVLAAKAVLAGLVLFTLAVVITFTAFLTGQAILSGNHAPHLSLGAHNVLLHLLGNVCYMTAAGLIGLFAGMLLRSAAAAVTSMFGLLLVLPVLADKITPDAVTRHSVPYLPANLGDEMLHHHAGLSPETAVAGLTAWVLVLAAAAAFSLRDRDA
jgi:ABC-type transport system involved in multi-copper enzyme maturation permease subunit